MSPQRHLKHMSPSPPRLEPRKAAHPASCHKVSHYILPPPTKETARSFVSCTVTYDRTVSLSHTQNPQPTSFLQHTSPCPVQQLSINQLFLQRYKLASGKGNVCSHTHPLFLQRQIGSDCLIPTLPPSHWPARRQPVRLALNLACTTRWLNYRRRTTSS